VGHTLQCVNSAQWWRNAGISGLYQDSLDVHAAFT
jgi:hypothetical protein